MSDTPVREHIDAIAEAVPLAGIRAVDVGCGKGVLVRQLAAHGARVTGLEIEADKLAVARSEPPVGDERYLEGRGEAIPLPAASADLVTFMFSLHHVPVARQRDALAEAARVLAPGGWLVIAEPLAEGAFFQITRLVEDETEVRAAAQAALADAPSLGLAPVGSHTYRQRRRYRDVGDVRTQTVAVDPSRAAAFDRNAAAIEAAFHAGGRLEDGRYIFDQPVKMDLFRKG